jgi:CBS domain containing-hemolysin-like protein
MTDIFIFTVLIFFSALFSAAETSLFSIRESQVRLMLRQKKRNAHFVANLKSDPQRLLVTILIGNNTVNLTIASLATVLAIGYFDSFSAGIATGASTVVILLLGEIFPKTIAFTYMERVTQFTAPIIYLFYILLYPISTLFVWLEQWFKRHTHMHTPNVISEEEIRIMAELGLEHGEINHYEHEMIENIFDFDDITVSEVMTPKNKMETLNGEVPVEQIAYFVSQSGYSRFPVYDGNPESYVGYVHTNDVMRVLNSDNRAEPTVAFVSPLTRVDETENIEQVFRRMTRERSHMFLVCKTGDPEGIVGLVTMEDILEEIMGEIEDEGDRRDNDRRRKKKSSVPIDIVAIKQYTKR